MLRWSWGCILDQQNKVPGIKAHVCCWIWAYAVCPWNIWLSVEMGLLRCMHGQPISVSKRELVSHAHRYILGNITLSCTDVVLCTTKVSFLWIQRLWGIHLLKASLGGITYLLQTSDTLGYSLLQTDPLMPLGFVRKTRREKESLH